MKFALKSGLRVVVFRPANSKIANRIIEKGQSAAETQSNEGMQSFIDSAIERGEMALVGYLSSSGRASSRRYT